ncbi:MAG: quercetin dioxygenase-like cupin family protein [Alteromonadaceae bacterium]|jgi:quercetin dioxygenase-like cupin family protein
MSNQSNNSPISAVWDNFLTDADAPEGFKYRDTFPENKEGVTVLLETWEAGTVEDPHHHPHDDMTVMIEGKMHIVFYIRENSVLVKDGEELTLNQGETGYIAANRIHSATYIDTCKIVYVQDKEFGFIEDQ